MLARAEQARAKNVSAARSANLVECTGVSQTFRKHALARWHQDWWFQAKLSRPPCVTPVIKRKELAAGFAGSKVQRVGKVDSLPTMT
jgi:hypothetical protein